MADYCTIEDLNRYMSTLGTDAFSDHDQNGVADENVIEDCITEATDTIDLFVLKGGRYDRDDLDGNTLLRAWCVSLAACELCRRRGNPVPMSFAEKCQQVMELLADVRDRKMNLPGVQRKDISRPAYSNLTVDRRYPISKIRVKKTNASYPGQHQIPYGATKDDPG